MAPLAKALCFLTFAATALAHEPQHIHHKRQIVATGTGTGTGFPLPSATGGAPYPIFNGTLPYYPTATGGTPGNGGPGNSGPGNGGNCPSPRTVTVTAGGAGPTGPAGPPYPTGGNGGNGGNGGSPTGTAPNGGTGTAPSGRTGTAPSAGPSATIGYSKRYEMRGLEQFKKAKKSWF